MYRLLWSRARRAWIVASGIACGCGRNGQASTRPSHRLAWALAIPLGLPLAAAAVAPQVPLAVRVADPAPRAPSARALADTGAGYAGVSAAGNVAGIDGLTGGHISAGQGRIEQSAHATTITQSSQRLSLDWQTFDVGTNDSVTFIQPNAWALAVNRIADPDGSVILGRLNANGQVWLVNPNGILFGRGARVNVGGLVASTLDPGAATDGTVRFGGSGTARVVNRGTLNATRGGYVALIGAQVSNQGDIHAPRGSVALGAGRAVDVQFDGNRLLSLEVRQGALDALAENRQLIQADGGRVLMTAGARDGLLASVVNNSGVIQARTVESRDGRIVLLGGMQDGTTTVGGTLDASAPDGGDGGFIETSAAHVRVDDGARITTLANAGDNGEWLIDPQDFTIAASGGDITGAALGAQLAGGNVSIESSAGATMGSGDINVDAAVDWNANTLTLTAANSINVNATMTAGGTAGLALNPATANGADAAVRGGTVNIMPGLGRVDFTGSGNSLSISGTPYTLLTSLAQLQGMNGDLGGHYALASDIDASATSGWNADGNGGFAGFEPIGTGTYGSPLAFTGVFDGLGHAIDGLTINRPDTDSVGLFGAVTGADASVRNVGLRGGSTRGHDHVGALVGFAYDSAPISHAYATGNVYGRNNVGGLIGYLDANADHIYATGDVEGTGNVGGLIGYGENSQIQYTYASGDVHGGSAGGLAGAFQSFSPWYSYATGDVTGTVSAGGLVGSYDHGTVWMSYATGKVTGGTSTGGLIGDSQFTHAIFSYWDKDSTGQLQVCGGAGASDCTSTGAPYDPVGLDTAEAFQEASYVNFNFDDTWFMVEGQTRPFLRFEHATSIGNAHQLQLMAMDLTAGYTLAGDIDASVADGTRASGMWGSAGFVPIGNLLDSFTGEFDGSGHAIRHLAIDQPTGYAVGLFGRNGGSIHDLELLDADIVGDIYTGGLVGRNDGTIDDAYVTGAVEGTNFTGGLVGRNSGSIGYSRAAADVDGAGTVTGGLVGANEGSIDNAFATGNVTGADDVGGLVGNNLATIAHAYATGAVSGSSSSVGGLVGVSGMGTITQSFATGTVTGAQRVGGLVGTSASAILQSYATGAVTGDAEVGGLVGYNLDSVHTGTITQSYATGAVAGTSLAGGLVGRNEGTVADSYWDTESTGQATSAGGTGLTSAAMELAGSFAGWDTATGGGSHAVWRIYEGHTTPLLRAFMTAASGHADDAGRTYDGTAFGDYDVAFDGVTPGFWLPGTAFDPGLVSGQAHSDATHAGSYALDGAGLYSGQLGYDLDIAPGTLTIDPRALTVALVGDLDKVYDGSTSAALDPGHYLLTGFVDGEGAVVTQGIGAYNSKNVADADTVIAMLSAGDFSAANGTLLSDYVLPAAASGAGHITPRGITVDAIASDKVYDATTAATVHGTLDGVLGSDDVDLASLDGAFADKNVGAGKTVTIDNIALGGADAGNYMVTGNRTATADITPATLVYVAAPGEMRSGQTPQGLSGTVAGLVGGESLAEATDGDLSWSTPATADSPAGHYAINGGGLQARNYAFVQAPGNAAALTVRASSGPMPISVPAWLPAEIAALQQQLVMPYRLAAQALAFPDSYTRAVRAGRAMPPPTASGDRRPNGDLYAPDIRVVDGGVHLP
jgi:filamentous hemagglutinin family protein